MVVLIKSSVKGQKDCKVMICNETVEFNSEGVAEVSTQEKAEEIVAKWGSVITILDKDGNDPLEAETTFTFESVESVSGKEDKPSADSAEDTTTDVVGGALEEVEIDLEEKTVAQLRELCSSIGLPSSEYKALKKPELISYIEEKIK